MPRLLNLQGESHRPKTSNFIDITGGQRFDRNQEKVVGEVSKFLTTTTDLLSKLGHNLASINQASSRRFYDAQRYFETDLKSAAQARAIEAISELRESIVWEDPKDARRRLESFASETHDIVSPNESLLATKINDSTLANVIHNVSLGSATGRSTREIERELRQIIHEMNQFASKDNKQYTTRIKFVAHRVGDLLGFKDATQQLETLDRLTSEWDVKRLEEHALKIVTAGIIFNVLGQAKDTGSTENIRDFLGGVNEQNIGDFYPPSPAAPASGVTKKPPGGPAEASRASNHRKTMRHFYEQRNEIFEGLKKIKNATDKEMIAEVNHASIDITKAVNSMMPYMIDRERADVTKVLEEVEKAFTDKSRAIGVKVNYIEGVGSYDFAEADANKAFAEFKHDMIDWNRNQDIRFVHKDGKEYTEDEIEKFMEKRRKAFIEDFEDRKKLQQLLRDKEFEKAILKEDQETPPTFEV